MRIEDDIAYQARGVDRRIKLTGTPARVLLIEEKVRDETYTDFALEHWSVFERQVLGWIAKPNQLSDFLIYVFLAVPPSLPFAIPTAACAARSFTETSGICGDIRASSPITPAIERSVSRRADPGDPRDGGLPAVLLV